MPHRIRRTLACIGVVGLSLACASSGPAPDRSAVEGTVRARPHEGVEAQSSGGGYGDRRLRGVTLVDYDRPGFAVVYVDDAPTPTPPTLAETRLSIRDGNLGPRISPTHTAGRVGSTLRISNASGEAHLVSVPSLGFVGEVGPRGVVDVALDAPGPHRLFLLDAPDAESLVFAAPGPFTVVSGSGRFELGDLEPGARLLRVWHPRLPPSSTAVRLSPGAVTHAELVLGVGHSGDDGVNVPFEGGQAPGPAEVAP